jgi:hypothetical protein
VAEQRLREGGQPVGLHVLDDLDDGGGVELVEATVAPAQGTLDELQAVADALGGVVEAQSTGGAVEDGGGDVHAQDAGELRALDQRGEQLALAAAEVRHALGAELGQQLGDPRDAPLLQRQRRLQGRLARGGLLVGDLRQQPRQRATGEAASPLEVVQGDLVAFWMIGQPALAPGEQLVDLVVADPVVLVVVEDGDEHVEVAQGVPERERVRQHEVVQGAVAPLRVLLVARQPGGLDCVPQGLEQPAQHGGTAS